MNLQLPKVISKDLARQVIEEMRKKGIVPIDYSVPDVISRTTEEVLAILFPDD